MNKSEEKSDQAQLIRSSEVTIGQWLTRGWEIVSDELGNFILLTFIYLVLIIALSFTLLGELLISGPLTAGYFIIIFNKIKGRPFYIGDIAKGFNFFIAAVLADILISVFVTIGFFFLIIPGIIIWALYMFTFPFIVEKNLDFWSAMEESRKLISKNLFEFSVFAFIQLILLFVGFLLLGVGLLFTIPLIMAATACAYKDLVG